MLKITENFADRKTVRLRLDGTISSDTFSELTQAFSHFHDDAKRIVILDMAGVEYMNDEAARELAKRRGDRLRIINCSPFIATLLETISNRETRD